MWMAHGKQPANVPCLRRKTCRQPFAGWMRCVLLATPGASAGKWCALARSSVKLTPSSGSGVLATGVTVATARNCGGHSGSLSKISQHAISHKSAFCCISLGNMVPEPYSLTWPALPLSRAAKSTPCSIIRWSKHGCICRLIRTSNGLQSQIVRSLYDCGAVPVGTEGVLCRVVVATHQASRKKSKVGVTRAGIVYELFWTSLPQQAFSACDVVELYLHRGAFEPALSDEDRELDPDRWCSHSAWGQECWQVIAQWVWNLRLVLGHVLKPEPLRTTEFAPALSLPQAEQAPAQGYEPPVVGEAWKAGRYAGKDFALQSDGTVCCPAGKRLFPQEHRRERDGSLRIVFQARIADCRACQMRPQCQWHGLENQHPRRVSVLLHPRKGGSAPLLWRDWPRRAQRDAGMQLLRHQRVQVDLPNLPIPDISQTILSRAQRAHYRVSWAERLARNARAPTAHRPIFTLYGIPDYFAAFLGLKAG